MSVDVESPNDAATPSEGAPRTPSDDAVRNRSLITKLATTAARRWKLTLGLWTAILLIGLVAYGGGLAREGFPPVNLPIVVVDGTYFVDDAELVDAEVALPLQTAYREIDGVKEVQSFSRGNAFAVIVEFDDGFSSPQGAALLERATPGVDVPAEADVTVRPIDAT